ncbi:MAG TPA: hypothetical protein VKR41_00190 [Puia sp.]|nr:hypothetical protein [Puia sp.]
MLRKYSRMIAVLLLLVFSQKAGLRLWMHNWLHEGKIAHSRSASGSESLKLNCDCFDDAMMPLLESTLIVLPEPVREFTTLMVDRYSAILSADKVFYSLKGPPTPSRA